jgi:hypothetical protein
MNALLSNNSNFKNITPFVNEKTKETIDAIKNFNISSQFTVSDIARLSDDNYGNIVHRNISTAISGGLQNLDEKLFDVSANVKIESSRVSMHLDPIKLAKIFKQIDTLNSPEEWDVENELLKIDSYKAFLVWFISVKPQVGPGLGVSNKGYLIATWMKNKDRMILEFFPKHRVRWMLYKSLGEESEIASGESSISRLSNILSPYEYFFRKEI